MDRFMKHCDLYFEQTNCTVLHPIHDSEYHIDVLLYRPTQKYNFWKLVTMGASDYKMPAIKNTIGSRNEYIMFVDEEVDLDNQKTLYWFHNNLIKVALFAYANKTHITYAHSFEWKNNDPNDEMIAAFIEFPQVIENPAILHCKLGPFETVACLQVVLLNKSELDMLMRIGPQAFSEYLYPEDGSAAHFLSERNRSFKF